MSKRRKTRIQPMVDAVSHILSARDNSWLMERFINSYKGTGVLGPFRGSI